MPKITPGNRLYLYRLLSRAIGIGRQTLMPRVEEALTEDGLAPEDLGCETMRELCEQLPEFIKLTVFKKGYVYATVLANEEYDRALARAESGADKAAANGKPWKRKRGAKALKPVRPRHVERAPEPEPEDAAPAAETAAATEAAPEAESKDEGTPEAADGSAAEPEAEVAAEPEASPAPEPEPAGEPETEAEPEATSEPEPAPAPEPAHVPPITFTITYVPEPETAATAEPEDAATPGPAAEPAPAPASRPDATISSRAQSDLPRDFHADVRCSSEQLSVLYQVLPADVDPMATLEEDFRVARSTGALEGTRSNVTFALRYLQPDGRTPVRVTLRRSARAVAGKRWALTEVDAGSPEDVGLDGLSVAARGPWSAFVPEGAGSRDAIDPERVLAQTIALGSWDEALDSLAGMAAPEDWGPGRRVLRAHFTMTFIRARAEGLVVTSEDGSRATFDTGLLTEGGDPISAALEAHDGGSDIPWRLNGFSAGGGAPAVRYAGSLAEVTLDPSLRLPDGVPAAALARSPRLATTGYDPVGNRVVLLVPSASGSSALALVPRDGAYELVATLALADAYACARVTGSEQPSWLRDR